MKKLVLKFEEVANLAGYKTQPDGKLNLPATQECADNLARAATDGLAAWEPGDEPHEVVLTGSGPVWAYLAVAHALHGRCVRCTYSAPNATIVVWSHGV